MGHGEGGLAIVGTGLEQVSARTASSSDSQVALGVANVHVRIRQLRAKCNRHIQFTPYPRHEDQAPRARSARRLQCVMGQAVHPIDLFHFYSVLFVSLVMSRATTDVGLSKTLGVHMHSAQGTSGSS